MKDRIKYILFDLDGTITEPYEGITRSVEYSLNKFGITVEDRAELKKFIGPPLKYGYMTFFGMNEKDAEQAVAYYRETYSVKGVLECTLYDGIETLLENLSKKYTLILATSKPTPYAEKILDHFNLSSCFTHIVGATFTDKVSEKSDVIKKILDDYNISPDEAIMIGDRCYDTDGAHKNGVASIGVLYGYGTRDEFSSAEAVCDSVEELSHFFDL